MGQYHQLSDSLLELTIVLELVLFRDIFMVVFESICMCLGLHKFVCLSTGTAVHHSFIHSYYGKNQHVGKQLARRCQHGGDEEVVMVRIEALIWISVVVEVEGVIGIRVVYED